VDTTVVVMSGEHYFTEDPQSTLRTTVHDVTLRGHTLSVTSASGTFSPGGVDRGTAVLLRHVPDPPATGVALDIGCGWGPITLALALSSPGIHVYGVDTNERARLMAQTNADHLGLTNVTIAHPDEVPPGAEVDVIWSNPPIRVGKAALHEILTRWFNRLTPEGEAWLVVAKKLGADSLQAWLNEGGAGAFGAQRVAIDAGFRVLRVSRN